MISKCLAAFHLMCIPVAVNSFRVRMKTKTRKGTSVGKVVTMGDSYSSGTGIHRHDEDYEGGRCWRDWKTTPGAYLAKHDGLEGVNVACKGDNINEGVHGLPGGIYSQFEGLEAKYPADVASGWNGSTFLFTIGGNDLRTLEGQTWPKVLRACITSLYGACHKEESNQIANFDEVEEKLVGFYTTLAERAPNARIRAMGYPRAFQRTWHCVPVPGLGLTVADWADNLIDTWNQRIEASVARVKSASPAVDIVFVNVTEYVKSGACALINREVNAIVTSGVSISDASMHPSQRGFNRFYDALGNSLSRSLPPVRDAMSMPSEQELKSFFNGWDRTGDGHLSFEEVLAIAGGDKDASDEVFERLQTWFDRVDRDQDGFLTFPEFKSFMEFLFADEMSR